MTNRASQTQVLSIPAGDSYDSLQANHVYSCPDTRAYPKFDDTYITFRQRGGEMDRIYVVDSVYPLMPQDENTWLGVNTEHRERIRRYISDRAGYFASIPERQQHRFYLLSTSEHLLHRPRPSQPLQGRIRYTWQELIVGESVIER